jgi:hypothetical protein
MKFVDLIRHPVQTAEAAGKAVEADVKSAVADVEEAPLELKVLAEDSVLTITSDFQKVVEKLHTVEIKALAKVKALEHQIGTLLSLKALAAKEAQDAAEVRAKIAALIAPATPAAQAPAAAPAPAQAPVAPAAAPAAEPAAQGTAPAFTVYKPN